MRLLPFFNETPIGTTSMSFSSFVVPGERAASFTDGVGVDWYLGRPLPLTTAMMEVDSWDLRMWDTDLPFLMRTLRSLLPAQRVEESGQVRQVVL